MFQAIKPLGLLLAALPLSLIIPGSRPEPTSSSPTGPASCCCTAASAWLRFAERLDELAAFAAGLQPPAGADVVATVFPALGQTASRLMAYVETV